MKKILAGLSFFISTEARHQLAQLSDVDKLNNSELVTINQCSSPSHRIHRCSTTFRHLLSLWQMDYDELKQFIESHGGVLTTRYVYTTTHFVAFVGEDAMR